MGSISKTMVYTTLIYLVTLAYGLNFLFSAGFALLTLDFALFAVIILLPLFLYILYAARGRYEPLSSRQSMLEKLIFAAVVVSAVFIAVFIIPITYA